MARPRLLPTPSPTDAPASQARIIGTGTLPLSAIERDFPQARRNWRHDKGDQRLSELTESVCMICMIPRVRHPRSIPTS